MTTLTNAKQHGATVAEQVSDAYMTGDYGSEWTKVGGWLAAKSFNDKEIEAILRSKYMRWASDHNGGKCTLAGFKKFWAATPALTTPEAVADLVAGTF